MSQASNTPKVARPDWLRLHAERWLEQIQKDGRAIYWEDEPVMYQIAFAEGTLRLLDFYETRA